MAKGNKIKNEFIDDIWKDVFYTNVGTYVNIISQELGKTYQLEPLSKHLKIGGGYAFKTSQYKKSGIPIIRISDFNNEKIDISNCVFYDEDPALSKYELNFGDIIICLTGGTISKLGIVQENLGKLYLNQRVGRFDIINEDEFEKEYVYWIAKSVSSIIKNLAWGAAIPNVSPKQIEKLEFAIPPVDVQQNIIRFLNDLKDENIEGEYFDVNIQKEILKLHTDNLNQKNLSAELNIQLDFISKLRQAFLKEAMQGKLVSNETSDGKTGAQLLAKIQTEKEKLIQKKKIKKGKPLPPISEEEIPFEIPENWVWCRLGEISYITSGSTPSADSFQDKGIPYFKMYNLKDQKIDFWHKPQFIKEEVHNGSLKRCRLKPGDVLMNIVGPPLGKLAIIPLEFEQANFNQAAVLIRSYNYLVNPLIFWYLNEKSAINEIETKGVAGQANISVTQAHNIKFPLPPLEIQNRIVSKLEELMNYCDDLETAVKESQNYNAQLLQQVLREALEVKEVSGEI